MLYLLEFKFWGFPPKYDAADVRSSLGCDWENEVLFNLRIIPYSGTLVVRIVILKLLQQADFSFLGDPPSEYEGNFLCFSDCSCLCDQWLITQLFVVCVHIVTCRAEHYPLHGPWWQGQRVFKVQIHIWVSEHIHWIYVWFTVLTYIGRRQGSVDLWHTSDSVCGVKLCKILGFYSGFFWEFMSSGMWCNVARLMLPSILNDIDATCSIAASHPRKLEFQFILVHGILGALQSRMIIYWV
jgi:hypothetical protein